jgi:hypothetical protein
LMIRNTMIGSIIVGNTTSTTDSASTYFGAPQILAFPYAPHISAIRILCRWVPASDTLHFRSSSIY